MTQDIFITSPLEQFEVTKLIGVDSAIIAVNLSLTNLGFYSLLSILIILTYHVLSNNNFKIIPSNWSISLESMYASLYSMVKEQIGTKNEIYFPFIYSLFFFLLISNLIGNVPYNYAIGTSIIQSLGLSFIIFIGVTLLSLSKHSLHFFSFFVPGGTPGVLVPLLVMIELISYVARAFSLGVRLFANLVAGHTLLKILSGMLWPILTSGIFMFFVVLLPVAIFTALVGLEIAVSFIQAFVFTLLTCSYFKDAIDLH